MKARRVLRTRRALRARLTAGVFVFLWEAALVAAAIAIAFAVSLLVLALV